jgi:hypothetical protein
MANVVCYRYNFSFAQGLPKGTFYYGYISFQAPPLLVNAGTSTITAVPFEQGTLTITETAVAGPVNPAATFTMRNDGQSTIHNWTIFLNLIQP